MQYRPLGGSGLQVSAIAMGCWPIAGMTSLQVTRSESLATLLAAHSAGINFFDTAYCYGAHGESEKLIAEALGDVRDEIIIASKGGIRWDDAGNQVRDARPATLRAQCEESLLRLNTDRIDLHYLHAPDPNTPIAESAGELKRLMDEGKIRHVGASNLNVQQLNEFVTACPLTACQPHYNMLQREIEQDVLPWCRAQQVAVCIYWPLLKGVLTGKMGRDHEFQPGDGRPKYPMFQGEEWQRNQDLLDVLRKLASDSRRSVTELVLAWTLEQPGITVALCGAKRPEQIRENAAAGDVHLTADQRATIEQALLARGKPYSQSAVS